MDKSFTSLTYKKGPSRQECTRFIAKFKSVVLTNSESEQNKMDHNQGKHEPKDENETSERTKHDQTKPKFIAYRIRIGDDYVITINEGKKSEKGKRTIIKTNEPTNRQQGNQTGNKKPEESVSELIDSTSLEEKPPYPQTSTAKTTLAFAENANVVFRETQNKASYDEELPNESDDMKAAKLGSRVEMEILNAKRTKETSKKTTFDTVENIRDELHDSGTKPTKILLPLQANSETKGIIKKHPKLNISINKVTAYSGKENQRTTKSSESARDIEAKEPENSNLQLTDNKNKRVLGSATVKYKLSIQATTNQESRKSAVKASPQEDTIQKMPAIQEVYEMSSYLLKNFSPESSTSFVSVESDHPFKSVRQELNELLQVASLTGVSSESLFRILCNILEEVTTIQRTPIAEDSPESTISLESLDENVVLMSNNYYIVNIEQIKSMAEILDRINKVVSTLIKYCNAIRSDTSEQESTKEDRQDEGTSRIARTIENNSKRSSSTFRENHTRGTNTITFMPRSNESTSTITEKVHRQTKKYTVNVVEIADGQPFDKGAVQSINSNDSSVDPQSFLTDSFRSNTNSIRSSSIPGSHNTMASYQVHHLNSLGSQTSESDLEVSLGECKSTRHQTERETSQQSDESEKRLIRKKSRFRATHKRSNDAVNTKDELLALLDNVEKLLINNSADRYEMMILLEQIFTEYSKSAQKAVTDLGKFIVTFNKNNSYL